MNYRLVGVLLGIIFFGCSKEPEGKINNIEEVRPPEYRFTKEVFASNIYEPTELVVLPKGKVLFTERRGAVMSYDLSTNKLSNYDSISVFDRFEHGLMGMALDPNFENNQWIYFYYSPVGEKPVQYLSRFTYFESGLKNEKVVLEVDIQRETCCHTGGSIEFGADGLLYLSTGDDTNPFASGGFAPRDERDGRSSWDAGRSSGNSNDLRGKILRIKPEPDGSYSIPSGNLFVDDNPLTRPEIYVMGCRNPYRIAIDSERNWLFWGDVGPDARSESDKYGPRGHDEFNVALKAGNFGWPLFIGDNKPYRNYDFETEKPGDYFNPEKPLNDSPNNSGVQELPAAMPAKIFYPYANSSEFPQVKNGGRNAMAGPVYYSKDYEGDYKFPSFFDGRVFYYDWIRGFVYSLSLDEEGNPIDWYPFMSSQKFNNLIDMTFGPDGQLYIIEYGKGWFTRNTDATLSRIGYNAGNLPPIMKTKVSKLKGAAPLEVVFDASESYDYDADKLFFNWDIDGYKIDDSVFTYTFEKEGVYYPELILKDIRGNKVRKQFTIEVGNEVPEVKITVEGNNSFYWNNRKVKYSAFVSDKEDGEIGSGILEEDVVVDIAYYQSLDQAEQLGHKLPVKTGLALIESLDCQGCHKIEGASIGPSYLAVSERYNDDSNAVNYLSKKIINGGGGIWGEQAMSAHPELSEDDARSIADYILSLGVEETFSLQGEYKIDKLDGNYAFQATYQDRGKKPLKPNTITDRVWLKYNIVDAVDFDFSESVKAKSDKGKKSWVRDIYHQSYFGFSNIDLTNIQEIKVSIGSVKKPGVISLRVGNAEGLEISQIEVNPSNEKSQMSMKVNTQGFNDLYFVFLNPDANNWLMTVEQFEFVPTKK